MCVAAAKCKREASFGDSQSAGEGSTEVCLVLGEEPGQAEIANLGLELVVQEYVAGLVISPLLLLLLLTC
jgi:hypothetical protein